MVPWWLPVDLPNISAIIDRLETWLVSIERSFQGLFVAIEIVRIDEELMEIWPNEVCDTYTTPAYAYQQPISNTSHNGHNYFDSDNTLSMSAEYDFMNRGILPLISNLSLNKLQSLYTEILITFIIMSNTIPKECTAHFTEYVVPFLTCI